MIIGSICFLLSKFFYNKSRSVLSVVVFKIAKRFLMTDERCQLWTRKTLTFSFYKTGNNMLTKGQRLRSIVDYSFVVVSENSFP